MFAVRREVQIRLPKAVAGPEDECLANSHDAGDCENFTLAFLMLSVLRFSGNPLISHLRRTRCITDTCVTERRGQRIATALL